MNGLTQDCGNYRINPNSGLHKQLPFCRNFLEWECLNFLHNLTVVHKGSINKESELVQIMAWSWTGSKPLSEPKLTDIDDAMYDVTRSPWVNSLAPGGFENIFQNVFFKLISWIDTLSNSCETALRSMPQNPSGDKSTLVQVMAWCRQATSHYLSQCCPRSLSPYGVTRPQWVNTLRPVTFSNAFSWQK